MREQSFAEFLSLRQKVKADPRYAERRGRQEILNYVNGAFLAGLKRSIFRRRLLRQFIVFWLVFGGSLYGIWLATLFDDVGLAAAWRKACFPVRHEAIGLLEDSNR